MSLILAVEEFVKWTHLWTLIWKSLAVWAIPVEWFGRVKQHFKSEWITGHGRKKGPGICRKFCKLHFTERGMCSLHQRAQPMTQVHLTQISTLGKKHAFIPGKKKTLHEVVLVKTVLCFSKGKPQYLGIKKSSKQNWSITKSITTKLLQNSYKVNWSGTNLGRLFFDKLPVQDKRKAQLGLYAALLPKCFVARLTSTSLRICHSREVKCKHCLTPHVDYTMWSMPTLVNKHPGV